jgi:catechol 2,3-dioxygenase-like lactoylglutathione lyase family enzyme
MRGFAAAQGKEPRTKTACMTEPSSVAEADRRLPCGGEIFLDHVGHFVRDPAAASRALVRAGFAPTPVSNQVNPDGSPTGTGNITAMFDRGYVEALFQTADTPLGRELDAAVARYPGLHLVAFAVTDAAAAHARLAAAGFRMRPLAQMQRPVDTARGPDIAAFSVARVEPGEMAEGRIQILTHRTEHTVWQERFLSHPNGAVALADLVIAVADLDAAAERYARFLGRPAAANDAGRVLRLDRGRVQLVAPAFCERLLPGIAIPPPPFVAAYAVIVRSLDTAAKTLDRGGVANARDRDVLRVPFPAELGVGAWCLAERAGSLPWRA